jgi:hypothetical protein
MRVRALLCLVAAGALPFFACGRSDLEDDDLDFPGFDGGGVGSTTSGGFGGIGTGGISTGGIGNGGSGGIGLGGSGGTVTGGTGGTPFGGAGGIVTGGSGGTPFGGSGGIPIGGAGGITGGTGGISVGGFGGIVTGGTGGIKDGGNIFDSFPFPDSGPIADCVACADENCNSQINACFNNPACAQGVVCAATSCGGFNLQCILQCFGGNFQAGLQAFQSFLCLAQNCGQQCIGVITGGGGPGGGGGPVPPPNSSESFTPRAGGWYGNVSPEASDETGLPEGNVYVPSIEVLDALQGSPTE